MGQCPELGEVQDIKKLQKGEQQLADLGHAVSALSFQWVVRQY